MKIGKKQCEMQEDKIKNYGQTDWNYKFYNLWNLY